MPRNCHQGWRGGAIMEGGQWGEGGCERLHLKGDPWEGSGGWAAMRRPSTIYVASSRAMPSRDQIWDHHKIFFSFLKKALSSWSYGHHCSCLRNPSLIIYFHLCRFNVRTSFSLLYHGVSFQIIHKAQIRRTTLHQPLGTNCLRNWSKMALLEWKLFNLLSRENEGYTLCLP